MIYEKIFREFYNHHLNYTVIGGVAVNLHGYARATGDLDIILALSDGEISKFVAIVKNLGMVPRLPVAMEDFANKEKRNEWITQKNMKVFSVYNPQSPLEHIDIKIEGEEAFNQLLKNSVKMKIRDFEITVVSLEDLIALKIEAGRGRDLTDIQALRKIQEIKNGS